MRGLLVAQFFGAFNDNAWKLIIITIATRAISVQTGGSGIEFESASNALVTKLMLYFLIPFAVFSLPAGVFCDRLSKRTIIVLMKLIEVALMAGGAIALFIAPTSMAIPIVLLGCMGLQSALFSPAKYGILPEVLPHEKLSKGNGLIEMWTMLAIIAGTGIGPSLLFFDHEGKAAQYSWLAPALLAVFAGIGLAFALTVPRVKPARSEGGVVHTVSMAWTALRSDGVLMFSLVGSIVYWTLLALVGQVILVYAKGLTQEMTNGELMSGMPPAFFGVGIAVGAVTAGRLSGAKVEYGLIPLGGAIFALLLWGIGLVEPNFVWLTILTAFLGMGAGMLVVPLHAIMQWRSPEDRRGAVIALINVFTNVGMIGGSLAALGLARSGFESGHIIMVAAVVMTLALIGCVWYMPLALLRLLLILLTHTLYRLRVVGRENVPEEGPALIVPNHVSFVDGLLIIASTDRHVRFIMDESYFHRWWLAPFMRSLGAIPISSSGGPKVILRALRRAGEYLEKGEVVCIFAEGQISRTGGMQPFRRGLERILKGRTAPVIPAYLDRLWGSIFSYAGGRFVTKMPVQIPYPVTVAFGEPLAPETKFHEVRRAVLELGAEAQIGRQDDRVPLHCVFARSCRQHMFKMGMKELEGPPTRRLGMLAGSLAIARALKKEWTGQQNVGILLPSGKAGVMTNIAAAFAGKTSVNLNYTAGVSGMVSAVRQAEIQSVVTSKIFLKLAKIELPDGLEPIWIEEIARSIGFTQRLMAGIFAIFCPARYLERFCGATKRTHASDVVTIIFSSGSTGEPKGIMLTHANIASNVDAAAQIFQISVNDRIMGILPLFHSFGTMVMWFAATNSMGLLLHPNPLDASGVGELAANESATMLLATPTFLQMYLRRCSPAQFGSLRIVLTGAEKLPDRLADAFEDRFGIRPMEGYGTTECSPVIAASAEDYRAPGFFQPGSRRGFVGHPLSGVAVRIVDPDSFEVLAPDQPGMLIVRGPNVMKGYVGRDDLTDEAIRDGWYITGDIAIMNEDGFIKITDRLARFSKIGGEMVPHGKVEDALHEALDTDERVFVVTGAPDERKGERLVVLYTSEVEADAIPGLIEKLQAAGLPNLFIPKKDAFVPIEEIPILGTGKIDLQEAKRIAAAHHSN